MTKIKMMTRAQGPNINMEPDKEYDVDINLARALVNGGFATCNEDLTPKKPLKETAELKNKKETATAK